VKRKGGGAKLLRTETVTVRLSPKLRYLAEIAARTHRRTVSSFLEWAAEEAFHNVHLPDGSSLADLADVLWDIDEGDRFAALASRYPGLLTHDELVLWKLIRDNPYFWRRIQTNKEGYWLWDHNERNLKFEALREWWETLQKVARGEQPRSALPERDEQPIADAEGRNSNSDQGENHHG
jgi:hypothetical protein